MPDVHRTIDAVWKLESARIVGGLARHVRDVGLAEELAQDALVDALVQWPEQGTPRNPGAWLMAVGKRKAIDRFRRDRKLDRLQQGVGRRPRARLRGRGPMAERQKADVFHGQ